MPSSSLHHFIFLSILLLTTLLLSSSTNTNTSSFVPSPPPPTNSHKKAPNVATVKKGDESEQRQQQQQPRRGIKSFFRWIKSTMSSSSPSSETTTANKVSEVKTTTEENTTPYPSSSPPNKSPPPSPKSSPSKSYQNAKDDVLFRSIEKTQMQHSHSSSSCDMEPSFGHLLDAGTGSHSLRWIASLIHHHQNSPSSSNSNKKELRPKIERYTAVTADQKMHDKVLAEATSLQIAQYGTIKIGDWASTTPPLLCEDERYDTILADYLIGAVDGFAPYHQDAILQRLVQKHLKPGGRIFVVGLEPLEDQMEGDGNVVCRVRQVRDACILLAGHRCYREYPQTWIHRQLLSTSASSNAPPLKLLSSTQFPILYSHSAIVRQINVARSKLPLFPSKQLADEMKVVLDNLEKEAKEKTNRSKNGRLSVGFDYVVAAELPSEEERKEEEGEKVNKEEGKEAVVKDEDKVETMKKNDEGKDETASK